MFLGRRQKDEQGGPRLQFKKVKNDAGKKKKKKKSTRVDVDHLFAKWRITVSFSNYVGLIYLAM